MAAVPAVAFATLPAGEVAAPEVSSLVQLSGVPGRLPQVASISSVCDGKTTHRTLVRSVAGPLNISSVHRGATEHHVVVAGFDRAADRDLLRRGDQIGRELGGGGDQGRRVTVEPTDHGYSYVVDSSAWGTAAISMTRCLRAGAAGQAFGLGRAGRQPGWPGLRSRVHDPIDQYKLSASRRATLHSRTVTSLAYKFFATTAGLVGRLASRQGLFQVTRAQGRPRWPDGSGSVARDRGAGVDEVRSG